MTNARRNFIKNYTARLLKTVCTQRVYVYLSSFLISQKAKRQATAISQSFFQSFNTPCAKLLVYLRVFSISQYAMRHGTEREIVTISLFFAWYFVIAPPAFAVYIDK